MKKKAHIGRGA